MPYDLPRDTPAAMAAVPSAPSFWATAWQRLSASAAGRAGLSGAGLLLLVAVVAPLLASDAPLLWRLDDGPWSSPWCASLLDRNLYEGALDIVLNSVLLCAPLLALPTWLLRRLPALCRRRPARRLAVALLWLAAVGITASLARPQPKRVYREQQQQLEAEGYTVLAVYPPIAFSHREPNLQAAGQGPSLTHPLGTDTAGRDVLARMLFGTRVTLAVGVVAVLLYVLLGTAVGAIAGYFGGWVDAVIVRLVEVVMSVPSLFLVLAMAGLIEHRSLAHVILVIAAVRWTGPARIVRAEILRLRHLDFVTAARAVGFPAHTIIIRELLPNALGPVLVTATFGVAASILVEATMSFLGLGDISAASWGQILSAGRSTGHWPLILAPGLAIFVSVGLLNLLGDALRHALDPQTR